MLRRISLAVASLVFVGCGVQAPPPCAVECGDGTACDPTQGICVVKMIPVEGAGGGGGGLEPVTGIPCDVAAVVQANCASCHRATPQNGAPFQLLNRADFAAGSAIGDASVGQRSVIRMRAALAQMPPDPNPRVDANGIQTFEDWVTRGMQTGSCVVSSGVGGGSGGAGGGSGVGGGSSGVGGGSSGVGGGTSGVGGGTSGVGGGTSGVGGGSSGVGGGISGVGGGTSGVGGGSTGVGGGSTGVGGGSSGVGGGTSGVGGGSTGVGGGSTGVGGGSSGVGGGTGTVNYCLSCTASAQCGNAKNFCIGASGAAHCGTDCSTGQACPSGASCVQIVNSAQTVIGSNCVPTSGSCGGAGGGGGSSGVGGGTSGTGGGTTGTGGGSGTTCVDTYAAFASSFFSSHCATCHGTEFGTLAAVKGKVTTIRSRINNGSMPPSGLTSTEKTRILSWIDCGAKP